MTDLNLEAFKTKELDRQDLSRLLQEEAKKLLGTDFLCANHGKARSRTASHGLRRSIWFLREEKRPLSLCRKGFRSLTLR